MDWQPNKAILGVTTWLVLHCILFVCGMLRVWLRSVLSKSKSNFHGLSITTYITRRQTLFQIFWAVWILLTVQWLYEEGNHGANTNNVGGFGRILEDCKCMHWKRYLKVWLGLEILQHICWRKEKKLYLK